MLTVTAKDTGHPYGGNSHGGWESVRMDFRYTLEIVRWRQSL